MFSSKTNDLNSTIDALNHRRGLLPVMERRYLTVLSTPHGHILGSVVNISAGNDP
jgi:hypothetical protein